MQKLEVLEQFIKIYGDKINPELVSIKYCQTAEIATVEMVFSANPQLPVITNLKFITGDIVIDEDGIETDRPFFDPEADIVDNASRFITLGDYSLLNCIDNIFTKSAEDQISSEYYKNNSNPVQPCF
ncbi:MAG: hypothetical protein WCI92_19510 [Bacteroidota bacterium]